MPISNGFDTASEVKKKDQIDLGDSITKDDILPGQGWGGSFGAFGAALSFYLTPYGLGMNNENELLPPLPPYWSKFRDATLSMTVYAEDFWSGAVGITITQAASMQFEVEAVTELMARRSQELFNDANGNQGWGHFLSQHLRDFLTTDNGAFVEIDREDNEAPGSKVRGLYHLDSLRCWLTGNPQTPVLYQAADGKFRLFKWWQIFHISDMPNPRNIYFGVGLCAASRCYRTIRRRVAAELYDYQKMSGGKPQELNFLGGITPQQLQRILESNESSRQAQGMTVYGGAAIIAMMTKDAITNVSIPIASKPNNFDEETELEHASIKMSNALGIDKATIKPLTGKMGGTAEQSKALNTAAATKGLVLWKNRIQYFLSEWVLPKPASFHFVEVDMAQLKQKAEVFSTWTTALASAVGSQGMVLQPAQALQKLVDENQLDKEYLPDGQDITPGSSILDDDKPIFTEQEQAAASQVQQAVTQQVAA